MITASLRMFLELGVVQKFKIDYEVRSSTLTFLTYVCLVEGIQHLHFFASGAVPVAAHREEELPHRCLPQLETRFQRLAVHVCHDHRESLHVLLTSIFYPQICINIFVLMFHSWPPLTTTIGKIL